MFFNNTPLFTQCSFQLQKGETVLIYGKNAIGKSSLLKVFLGQVLTYTGKAKLFEKKPKKNRFDIFFNLGARYIPQFPVLPDFLTIHEYFEFKKDCIVLSVLENHLTNIPLDTNKLISQLSFGQKRLVEILFALSSNAKLIIVDELFAGISDLNSDYLKMSFKEYSNNGGALITTAHDSSFFINDRINAVELKPFTDEY